jgi:cytochrome oxidase Cu insertion factor (SCO1/SenC/PrrC family)
VTRAAAVALAALPAVLVAAALRFARPNAPDPERLAAVDPAEVAYTYGVGTFVPEYEPPAAGSYTLPVVDTIDDHPLLDADGRRTSLYAATAGRIAVVAFAYTSCVEPTGCPLGQAVLHQLDGAIAADSALADRAMLLTISFDPERDTPERLRVVRGFHAPASDWRFVTTPTAADLDALLADFGQPVAKLRYPDGTWSGLFRHVLKVFLLDRRHAVRNIYSTGFLNPRLVLNDVRTVLAENGPSEGGR